MEVVGVHLGGARKNEALVIAAHAAMGESETAGPSPVEVYSTGPCRVQEIDRAGSRGTACVSRFAEVEKIQREPPDAGSRKIAGRRSWMNYLAGSSVVCVKSSLLAVIRPFTLNGAGACKVTSLATRLMLRISLMMPRRYRQPSAGATWVRIASITWAL